MSPNLPRNSFPSRKARKSRLTLLISYLAAALPTKTAASSLPDQWQGILSSAASLLRSAVGVELLLLDGRGVSQEFRPRRRVLEQVRLCGCSVPDFACNAARKAWSPILTLLAPVSPRFRIHPLFAVTEKTSWKSATKIPKGRGTQDGRRIDNLGCKTSGTNQKFRRIRQNDRQRWLLLCNTTCIQPFLSGQSSPNLTGTPSK